RDGRTLAADDEGGPALAVPVRLGRVGVAVEALLGRLLAGRDGDEAGLQAGVPIAGELEGAGDLDEAGHIARIDTLPDAMAGPDDHAVAGLRHAPSVPGGLRRPGTGLFGANERRLSRASQGREGPKCKGREQMRRPHLEQPLMSFRV